MKLTDRLILSLVKPFTLVLAVCIFMQCQSDNPDRPSGNQKIKRFFDLETLISKQIELLSNEKIEVRKIARVDEKTDTAFVDNVNWEKELNIFLNADINKPKLFELYDSVMFQHENGDHVLTYRLKDSNSDGIISLEISRVGDSESIRKIKINRCDDNTMIISEFELILSFDPESDNDRLSSYRIKGYEKMILKDTIRYEMVSTLL